jgi:phosphatidylglycerol:prolipoprotein diacylglycerol transferase
MEYLVLTFPQIDPVALQIGPIAIRWYGLAYLAGILLGWRYGRRLIANDRLWVRSSPNGAPAPMTPIDFDDLLVWATLGIILGGRLGYVLFYKPAEYLADPLAAFKVWEGGMSFHGGLLGTILAMLLFARSRNIPVLSLLDVAAASVPFGLFFGRIANFINAELFGRPATVPWAMVFPDAGPLPRHPSQLYEAALEGVALFVILRILTHAFGSLRYPGLTGGAFVAGYGLARIIVEFFREPDAHLGYLAGGFVTMGMILSLPMVAVGLGAIVYALARGRRTAAGEGTGG